MRKTLIGIMIMTVAIMMTLSGAVLAANGISASASATNLKVGDSVSVTVTNPADTASYGYVVTYDPAVLEYTGSNASTAKDGKVTVSHMETNMADGKYTENTTNAKAAISFKALKEADSTVVTITPDVLMNTSGKKMTDADKTAQTVTLKVAKAEEAAPAENNKAEDTTSTETKTDADTTKKSLKDTKTGFDAMYVVYLAAAALVAGGIVTVARRK